MTTNNCNQVNLNQEVARQEHLNIGKKIVIKYWITKNHKLLKHFALSLTLSLTTNVFSIKGGSETARNSRVEDVFNNLLNDDTTDEESCDDNEGKL